MEVNHGPSNFPDPNGYVLPYVKPASDNGMPASETIKVVGGSRHRRFDAGPGPPMWFSISGQYKIFSPNHPASAVAFLGDQSSQ
jgi:hypothetical protein